MTVSLFGHRNIPYSLTEKIEKTLESLIENLGANRFYVGCNGEFDFVAIRALKNLKDKHPEIDVCIVLAYMPKSNYINFGLDTMLPEAAARSIPRFAIIARNRWMVEVSDVVVTYVTRSFGGAAKAKSLAIAANKTVIELSKHN